MNTIQGFLSQLEKNSYSNEIILITFRAISLNIFEILCSGLDIIRGIPLSDAILKS